MIDVHAQTKQKKKTVEPFGFVATTWIRSFLFTCVSLGDFGILKKKKEMTITSGCPEALTKIVVGITKTDVAFVFLPFPLKRKLTWCTVSVIVHTYTTLSPIDSLPTTHCCFFLIVNPSDNGSSKSWQRKKQNKNEKCPATGRPYVYTRLQGTGKLRGERVCVCVG